jgi:hypothetical protein
MLFITLVVIFATIAIAAIEIYSPCKDSNQVIVNIVSFLTPTLAVMASLKECQKSAAESKARNEILQGQVHDLQAELQANTLITKEAANKADSAAIAAALAVKTSGA